MSPGNQNTKGKDLCPNATAGCRVSCLFTAGRGQCNTCQIARLNKTEYFLRDKNGFMNDVVKEIERAIRNKKELDICVRLNGTSDIRYENIPVGGFKNIFEMFPSIQFYDYTKTFSRLKKKLPVNYHLTFSYAETDKNHEEAKRALELGFNVAVVFGIKDETELPATFLGYPVVNGDYTDLTFLYGSGHIIGLKAKGKGRKDTTGFVVRNFENNLDSK